MSGKLLCLRKVVFCLVAAVLVTLIFSFIDKNFYTVKQEPTRITIHSQNSEKNVTFRGAQVDGHWYNTKDITTGNTSWLYDDTEGTYTSVGSQPLKINLPAGTEKTLTFNAGPEEGKVLVKVDNEALEMDLWNVNIVELGLPYSLPNDYSQDYKRKFYFSLIFLTSFIAFLTLSKDLTKKQQNSCMEQEKNYGGSFNGWDKRKWIIFAVFICFIQSLIVIYWAQQKEAYYVDELFTYRSVANLYQQDDLNVDWYAGDPLDNIYVTHDEFMDYLTVGEGESIVDQSLVNVLKSVVLNNTFHVLMSLLHSVFRGVFTKWVSLIINIIVFYVVQYIFYKIALYLCSDYKMAVLLMGMYGMVFGSLETIIYVRHYEFFLLFTMLYTLLMLKMIEDTFIRIREVFLSLILIWFGYLSCQYMVIYAGLFFIGFLIACILKRHWNKLKKFVVCYFFAAVIFAIKISSGIKSSMAAKSGRDQMYMALKKLTDFDFVRIKQAVKDYLNLLWRYTESNTIFWIGLIILTAVLIKNGKVIYKLDKRKNIITLFTICVSYVVCVGWIAPHTQWRYISNIYAIFIILLGVFLAGINCQNNVKYLALLLCLQIGLNNIYLNGSSMTILNRGVDSSMRQDVYDAVGENDIIYMQIDKGDITALFYHAFTWPSGVDVYIASPKTFEISKRNADKILCQDTVNVWVDTESRWDEEIKYLMMDCGYRKFECVYFCGGDNSVSRFVIYQCNR